MLMIDKANGEIGTRIKHPLRAEVDRIIDREINNRKIKIKLSSFNSIRNTGYVRKRLEQRGFKLDADSVTKYVFANKPFKEFLSKPVLKTLQTKGEISNEGLSVREKEKLSQTIYYLKQRGYEIEKTRERSEDTGKRFSVYKLKNL